ncbi:PilN domain-containing protein [Lysobacter ciconiae]|uniref:PilN domain-containing protein n=1 Tax=Novilysobacter ciconiae TaxID=2781022 RepID=A0A7S6UGK6_9GAMM|nr:PilN domain-containing protein [Lysobacter ciconiae]QOW19903.1 PilN domain-containing protein [Lysobacter ciconiae]
MSQPGSTIGVRLGRVGTHLVPGVGGYLSWWGRSLAAGLPPALRQTLGFGRGRVLLQVDADEMQLCRQCDDALIDMARVPLPPLVARSHADGDALGSLLGPRLAELPRWLLLPAASSLTRRINLPASALERLRDVVGFEIDRQTPFTAEAVAFDARVLGRRESDGQLDVELVVVPRHLLDQQRTAMGPLASELAGVDVAGTDGAPLGVNLLPPEQRRRRRDPAAVWNAVLAGVALLATVALLWQLLENRRSAAAALEQVIASQADAGRRSAMQRQQLTAVLEGQVFLDRLRAERAPTTEILDELTRRLPDTTYLEKLSINGDQLMLIGLSTKAAALIGELQGAEQWRSPALAGALQPDPQSGRDRFTLTANLAAPAATPDPTNPAPPKTADAPAPRDR